MDGNRGDAENVNREEKLEFWNAAFYTRFWVSESAIHMWTTPAWVTLAVKRFEAYWSTADKASVHRWKRRLLEEQLLESARGLISGDVTNVKFWRWQSRDYCAHLSEQAAELALREDFLIWHCITVSPNCAYFQRNHEGIVVHHLADHSSGLLVLDRRLLGLRLHHTLPDHRLHSSTLGEFEFRSWPRPASYRLTFLPTARHRLLTQVHSVPEVLRREHDGRKSTLLRQIMPGTCASVFLRFP